MSIQITIFQAVKISLLAISCLAVTTIGYAQDTARPAYTRNVAWTTPVKKNTTINGLAIGFAATTWKGADFLKINGLNIEMQPLGLLAGMYALGGTISSLSSQKRDTAIQGGGELVSRNIFPKRDLAVETKINGISLSLGGLLNHGDLSGIGINGIVCFANKMNGIELTGLMNLHYEFNGIMIAGLRNKVTTGKGLQVGLFNTCKSGQVLQLGLMNRIGKRVTPLVNFSFKKA
jgi:hypothetical protein